MRVAVIGFVGTDLAHLPRGKRGEYGCLLGRLLGLRSGQLDPEMGLKRTDFEGLGTRGTWSLPPSEEAA